MAKWYWLLADRAHRDARLEKRLRFDEARYYREVGEPERLPIIFTLVPLAIGCAILVWVPILIPLWHWLRGF